MRSFEEDDLFLGFRCGESLEFGPTWMHVVLKYHQSDCKQLPDEDKLLAAMRSVGLTRGYYHFPHCTHKDMNSPAVMEKFKQGPVGILTVFPSGPPVMLKFMGMWFIYCLIIGFFVAYITGRTVAPGSNYLIVFRVAGTAGFLPTVWGS